MGRVKRKRSGVVIQMKQTDKKYTEEPEISVIIPIYNSEGFLPKTIESVLRQTRTSFELLLIDDGSSDRSLEICRRYEAADPRVRVFRKENTGVSDTRNLGLDMARGRYIRFIDSDDSLPEDSLENMIRPFEENEEIDMVIGRFESNSRLEQSSRQGIVGIREFLAEYVEMIQAFYSGVVWNKMFLNSVIRQHGIRFEPGLQWSEDLLFNLQYYRWCSRIFYVDRPVYGYWQRENSLYAPKQYSLPERMAVEYRRYMASLELVREKDSSLEAKVFDFLMKILYVELSSGENVRNYGQFRTLLGDPGLTECLNAFRGKSSYSIYNMLRRRILKKQFRRLYFFFDVKRRFMKLFSGDMKKRVQSLIRKSSYKY